MLKQGLIKPVIFETKYQGLESVPQGLQDLAARKVWGKAIVHVSPEMATSKL
jgi:NADPH2:quinone reductase